MNLNILRFFSRVYYLDFPCINTSIKFVLLTFSLRPKASVSFRIETSQAQVNLNIKVVNIEINLNIKEVLVA